MLDHLLKFPEYVRQGYALGDKFKVKGKVDKIIVCGMGGSGISGDILQEYVSHVPVFVNKDYHIPEFVDKNTLAIVISYSGNTEETISAYERIKDKTEKKIVITSGGVLGGESNVIKIQPGMPPRYSLPFLFFSMLSVLHNSGIVEKDFDIKEVVENLKSLDINKVKSFAKKLVGYTPIVYAPQGYGSVAYRWQTQFNENSKIFAHSHVFPEQNHNEIEAHLNNNHKVIMLRDPDVHERTNKRMEIISETVPVEHVTLKGSSRLSRMFYGILFGDLVSYYLALECGNDPTKQDKIDALKEKLKR